jgi:hypothetical protein
MEIYLHSHSTTELNGWVILTLRPLNTKEQTPLNRHISIYLDLYRSTYILTYRYISNWYISIYLDTNVSRSIYIEISLDAFKTKYIGINGLRYIDTNRWSYIDIKLLLRIDRDMSICGCRNILIQTDRDISIRIDRFLSIYLDRHIDVSMDL